MDKHHHGENQTIFYSIQLS